ncbi:hypothetical protein C8Q76DRAFT_794412 [Earliella scabrosa]|nr:hypothetical protein C8Q76DRAFT_794412 [Earliella scabrosa]
MARQNTSYSFTHLILPQDKRKFAQAKALMQKAIPEILDLGHTWGQQRPQRIRRLLATVLSAYPVFKNYENQWPVRFYCSTRLACVRYIKARGHHEPGTTRTREPRTWASADAHTGVSTNPASASEGRGMQLRNHTLVTSSTTGSLNNTSASTDLDDQPRADAISNSTSATSTTDRPENRAPWASFGYDQRRSWDAPGLQHIDVRMSSFANATNGPGEQEVRAFLRSIEASFEPLLDRFLRAGVTNRTRLRILAEWSASEVDAFLLRDVHLDPFERKVVADVLSKVFRGS